MEARLTYGASSSFSSTGKVKPKVRVAGAATPPASTEASGEKPAADSDHALDALVAMVPKNYHVNTEVQVESTAEGVGHDGIAWTVSPEEIEGSAGTYGDPSRFLATMAGVVSDNDSRNDFLVRGGNPDETLFVVDNIEVPSINHLALSDTTGGFVSMLDATAIQQLTLHEDAYDEKFDQRLSAVIEVSTRPTGQAARHSQTDAGLDGVGGSMTRPLGSDGSLFISAHQGILQYLFHDIGLDGTPHYHNAFVRADGRWSANDTWWGMSLTGIDSLKVRPCACDPAETNAYNIDYSGWRNTTGLNWQHLFSAKAFGVLSVAHAAQVQNIAESSQTLETLQLVVFQTGQAVYNEATSDQISTAKYDWTWSPRNALTLNAGARASVDQLNYAVAQPVGLVNPYDPNPTPVNAMGMARAFAPFSSAGYLQATLRLGHGAQLVAGGREEQWTLGGHHATTGKALFSMPVLGHEMHVGYATYQQLPPTLYLLSDNNLPSLPPIRSGQWSGGVTLNDTPRARVVLEAYQKRYADYPVAVNYPELSMANIADTFGQAFLLFPMTGQGIGLARGVELTVQTHLSDRTSLAGTVTYARDWYSGLDGVLRRGNYDIPLVISLTGVRKLKHNLVLSWRYKVSSGLVYTPDDMALSTAQNRDVYNLAEINGQRSGDYHRLDFRLAQSRKLGMGTLTWHVGLENAFDNNNFFMYQWEPRMDQPTEQKQMPIFPDGGMKFNF
jgi:hypothetical protein